MAAPDPFAPILHRLASCIRMLLATDGQRTAAIFGVQRMLEGIGKDNNIDVHALADRVEKGGSGLTEDYKRQVRAEIANARAIGYAEGVRAAEARFRPDGKLTFSEVALYAQRQINRIPPDKHEFISKMALYAIEEFEPSPKQGKFLFDLFVQYLGGRIT